MTLDAVIDELYAGDPAQFVARRDEAAKGARSAGDRESAAAIKALRRPSVGAWYVNVAVRAGLISLHEWLKLGERLRAAQAACDFAAVRAASAERAPLEQRVVSDLTAHLAAAGVAATASGVEEVRTTLRAALADEAAADAVRAARLSRPLEYAGFGEVDMSAALAAMAGAGANVDAPGGATGTHAEGSDAKESDAKGSPAGMDADADEADAADDRERVRRERAEAELESARRALADAEASEKAAERRAEQARRALAAAEKAQAAAEKALAAAEMAAAAASDAVASHTQQVAALEVELASSDESPE